MSVKGYILYPFDRVVINTLFQYYINYCVPDNAADNNKTHHLYEAELPEHIRANVQNMKNIVSQKINHFFSKTWFLGGDRKWLVFPIPEMNELYLSKLNGTGSDKIFESAHVDGPFFFLPYCNVYRCILGLSYNDAEITTHFPKENIEIKIEKYQFVAFDYNRDIHYISGPESIADDPTTVVSVEDTGVVSSPRVIYKLHYIVVPSFVPAPVVGFYKWIHISYNSCMRYLFIHSQTNTSVLAWMINSANKLYCWLYGGLSPARGGH